MDIIPKHDILNLKQEIFYHFFSHLFLVDSFSFVYKFLSAASILEKIYGVQKYGIILEKNKYCGLDILTIYYNLTIQWIKQTS